MEQLRQDYLESFGSRRLAMLACAIDLARSNVATSTIGYSPKKAALAAVRIFEASADERAQLVAVMVEGRAERRTHTP